MDTVSVCIDDFPKICRTCLKSERELHDIFDNSADVDISAILFTFAGIKVYTTDLLPKSLCSKCVDRLCRIYHFKNLCLKSNDVLLSAISAAKIEKEELPSEKSEQEDDWHDDYDPKDEIKSSASEPDEPESDDDDHTCERCGKKFTTKGHLRRHERLKCVKSRMFERLKRMKLRRRRRSESSDTNDCRVCGKQFKRKSHLRRHEKIHEHPKPEKVKLTRETLEGQSNLCPICGISFGESRLLKAHIRGEHTERPKSGQMCEICGKSFKLLRKHVLQVHCRNRRFKCKQCERNFSFQSELKSHLKLKHGVENPVLSEASVSEDSAADDTLNDENRAENEAAGSCDMCNAKFYSKKTLKRHIAECGVKNEDAANLPEDYKKCTICGKAVKLLKKHILQVHGESRRYKCKYCSKRFPFLCSLKTHIRTTHKQILTSDLKKPNSSIDQIIKTIKAENEQRKRGEDIPVAPAKQQCKICEKLLVEAELIEHIESHKPPFEANARECNACDMTFYYEQALQVHVKVRHPSKPQTCNICGKQVKLLRKHLLQVHSKIRPYKCAYCKRAFPYQSSLNWHMKEVHKDKVDSGATDDIGNGLNQTKCQICGKTFDNDLLFQRHEEVHNFEKYSNAVDIYASNQNNIYANYPSDSFMYANNPNYFINNEKRKKKVGKNAGSGGCNICGKEVKSVRKHFIEVHALRPHKCTYCERRFPFKSGLASHMKDAHKHHQQIIDHYIGGGVIADNSTCTFCNRKFDNLILLRRHEELHRLEQMPATNDRVENDTKNESYAYDLMSVDGWNAINHIKPEIPTVTNTTYDLPEPSNTMSNNSILESNSSMREANNTLMESSVIEQTNSSVNYDAQKPAQMTDSKNRPLLLCTKCDSKFYNEVALSAHMKRHHVDPSESHICSICGKTVQRVKKHMLQVHTAVRPHQCELCDKRFLYPNALRIHIETVHEGKKIHRKYKKNKVRCQWCGREFWKKSVLRKHEEMHQANKKFKTCPKCGAGFVFKAPMEQHLALCLSKP